MPAPSPPTPSPLDFDIRTPAAQQAWSAGFTRALPEQDPWLPFQAPRGNGTLWLAARKEPPHPAPVEWFLATDHPALLPHLGAPIPLPGPGLTRVSLPSTTALFQTLHLLYPLARDLPFSPVASFHAQTTHLPATTEAERLTIQRIGQDLFRGLLMQTWNARCPLTGITDPALLRASHIKPWSDCTTTEERLDPMNGLLLSALWDAAFDRGLVSFSDEGEVLHAPTLSPEARNLLTTSERLPIAPERATYLILHRKLHGFTYETPSGCTGRMAVSEQICRSRSK